MYLSTLGRFEQSPSINSKCPVSQSAALKKKRYTVNNNNWVKIASWKVMIFTIPMTLLSLYGTSP